MNLEQIKQGILSKFDKCRLVFWQDEDIEFKEQLPEIKDELSTANITLIELDDESHFEVKQRIELTETKTQFLLYSNKAINEPTRDWLYDIRLYAQQFYADSSSMILNELGMRMEFRQDISRYKKFFGNRQRYNKLRKLLPENADKPTLELAMIAVLTKVESVSFTAVLHQIISLYCDKASKAESAILELEKYDLSSVFWQHAINEFGYIQLGHWLDDEEAPTIKDLVAKLLITDCYQGLQSSGVAVASTDFAMSLSSHLLPISIDAETADKLPKQVSALLGNTAAKKAAVVNFVSSWRESRTLSASYNVVAGEVSEVLEIKQKLAEFKHPSQLLNVETFVEAEQQFIKLLAVDLPAYKAVEINDWVSIKLRDHWCAADDSYACIYKALRAAKEFYDLKDKYLDGFVFNNAKALYKAYEEELYKFDHAYRIFSENSIELQERQRYFKSNGLS